MPTVHKRQRRAGGKREGPRGGGGNSITSASSFTGQRDREPELWTTNEISKSWVRYLWPVLLSVEGRWVEETPGAKSWTDKQQGSHFATVTPSFLQVKRLWVQAREESPQCNFPSTIIPLPINPNLSCEASGLLQLLPMVTKQTSDGSYQPYSQREPWYLMMFQHFWTPNDTSLHNIGACLQYSNS